MSSRPFEASLATSDGTAVRLMISTPQYWLCPAADTMQTSRHAVVMRPMFRNAYLPLTDATPEGLCRRIGEGYLEPRLAPRAAMRQLLHSCPSEMTFDAGTPHEEALLTHTYIAERLA